MKLIKNILSSSRRRIQEEDAEDVLLFATALIGFIALGLMFNF